MHSEEWGDPRDPRGHRGHRRGGRVRVGPPWAGGAAEVAMRGGAFWPLRIRGGWAPGRGFAVLAEGQPWNGYQIIQEIAARTEGVWRPSAGSVYPALQQLEDEALVQVQAGEDRRRMFTLTDEGRAYVTEHADELGASWDAVTGSVDDAEVQLRGTIRQVMVAVSQVSQAGSAAQIAQAGKILADTRRALYRILAADDEPTSAGEDAQG